MQISSSNIALVLDALLVLVESLLDTDRAVEPSEHVVESQSYVLDLVADCCACSQESAAAGAPSRDKSALLPHLDDSLVARVFAVLKALLPPLSDGFVLPFQSIMNGISPTGTTTSGPRDDAESSMRTIVDFVTASNWEFCFDYFRNVVYTVRAAVAQPVKDGGPVPSHDERDALVVLRLVSFFRVDGRKLGDMIQELCSSFLHFRKPIQHTVAVVTPMLIVGWIDRCPDEFVAVHASRRRLDGGADTLWDMTQTISDGGRRKALVYPLQACLLLLLPDVFEVASNMRESKASSMSKKVAFLDSLRKALRNRSEHAGHCLVSLLQAARHFDAESDAAIVSYAMDVQDEVKKAVFRQTSGTDVLPFGQELMTAALVSLAHLSLETYADSLIPSCLDSAAPDAFKLAVIQACTYFAKQSQAEKFTPLLASVMPFVHARLDAFCDSQTGDDPAGIVCNILAFLEVYPTAFSPPRRDEPHAEGSTGVGAVTVFQSFIMCIVSPNYEVQALASRVLDTIVADPSTLRDLISRGDIGSPAVRIKFWNIRYDHGGSYWLSPPPPPQ